MQHRHEIPKDLTVREAVRLIINTAKLSLEPDDADWELIKFLRKHFQLD